MDDLLAGLVDPDYRWATGYLDHHIDQGVKPGLERIELLLDAMANPHEDYRVIHVAGTNGKTSTSRIVTAILAHHGLDVGTFTSPHLQRVEERVAINGVPLTRAEFTRAVADVASFVETVAADDRPTYFELTAAVALSAFAAQAVDVAVVEVGLGGRLDATNAVAADVSVLTGISLEHTEYLGSTVTEIAGEKAAILKDGGRLVSGPLPAAAEGTVTARVGGTRSEWVRYGTDFSVRDARLAVGGWYCDLDGRFADYSDLFLALHGRHQVTNLAVAVAAVETFFGRDLQGVALGEAAGAVSIPGRLEVAGRSPLVVLDGAHNREGMEALAAALGEDFPPRSWHLVYGLRGRRDPAELLDPLLPLLAAVYVTAPDDAGAVPADTMAAALRSRFPELDLHATATVPEAVARAVAAAGSDGAVVVAGSLYVVGEARSVLVADDRSAPGSRWEPPDGWEVEVIDGGDEDPDVIDLRE